MQSRENQNIWDVTLQEFGDVEYLFTLLNDNSLNVNSKLRSGQNITITIS